MKTTLEEKASEILYDTTGLVYTENTKIIEAMLLFASAAVNAKLQEELNEIWEAFDKEGMHGSQNYILGRINKLNNK